MRENTRWTAPLVALVLLSACPGDDTGGEGSTTIGEPTSTTVTDMSSSSTTVEAPDSSSGGSSSGGSSSGGSSGSSSSDPDSSTTASGSESSSDSSTGETLGEPVVVEWTDFMVINDCFLFSDPNTMGTDATWSDMGGMIGLTFAGTPATTAEGVLNGTDLELVAVTLADFGGDTWQYTETFTGMVVDGHYVGQWTYSECNMSALPETCPDDDYCGGIANFDVTLP